MAVHKHAEVIKAWADGAQIQVKDGTGWYDIDEGNQVFHADFQYRIKPSEPERVYPEVELSIAELLTIWGRVSAAGTLGHVLREMVGESMHYAIDAGQVVARDEFDRMCGDRRVRDMAVAKHVHDEIFRLAAIENGSGVRITSSLNVEKLLKGLEP